MKKRYLVLVMCAVFLGLVPLRVSAAPTSSLANSSAVDILNNSSTPVVTQPITFGQVFAPGEYPRFVEAVINGTPLLTQNDVKTRWADGSIKHVIISLIVPRVPGGGGVRVSFQSSGSGNNAGYLATTALSQPQFDLDVHLNLSLGNQSQTVRLQAMIARGSCAYWLQGPVATEITCADHSRNATFDMGFGAHRSFRPTFGARIYPANNEVSVRVTGEVADLTKMQNVDYNLNIFSLSAGGLARTFYQENAVKQHPFSAWTRKFGPAEKLRVKYDLRHLARVGFLPSFDPTKVVPEATIAEWYRRWQTSPRNSLMDPGLWTMAFSTSGGRGDIGHLTTIDLLDAYTADQRLDEAGRDQANRAFGCPLRMREGDFSRSFDGTNLSAGGRPVTPNARPTLMMYDRLGYLNDPNFTDPRDFISFVGPWDTTYGGWGPDEAHAPNFFSFVYLKTGDPAYLEQMLFVSIQRALWNNSRDNWYGRGGPNGLFSNPMINPPRGQAWYLRDAMDAIFFVPDGTAEKRYLEKMVADTFAIMEAFQGVTPSAFAANPAYTWALGHFRNYWWNEPPSLFAWSWEGETRGSACAYINCQRTERIEMNWQMSFLLLELGVAKKRGYPVDGLIDKIMQYFHLQTNTPGFNPYHIADFATPVRGSFETNPDRTGITRPVRNLAEVQALYRTDYNPLVNFYDEMREPDAYVHILRAGLAMVSDHPLFPGVWWIVGHTLQNSSLNAEPKWAISPVYDYTPDLRERSQPFITEVSAALVASNRPDPLRLLGANFVVGQSDVLFQGITLPRAFFRVLSPKEIEIRLPANVIPPQPSRYFIQVRNPDGKLSNPGFFRMI